MYVYGYPRQIYTGWLSSIINIDEVLDISMFIYPVDTQIVLNNLRKKVTQLEATMNINMEKGKVRDPGLEAALQDAEELRDQLQIGAEKFFRYGLYITLYADSLDELNFIQHKNWNYFWSAIGVLESSFQSAGAGIKQFYSAVNWWTTNSPQHEYWRNFNQLSVHFSRFDG